TYNYIRKVEILELCLIEQIDLGGGNLYTDSWDWIHCQIFAVLRNPNQLWCCYLLELWRLCCILTRG
ncbi:hypothetical protein RYX36_020941, partial [Vicia faba]